ncbi:V-type ATP synthase subunit I [Anaerosphaera multitolerans]|uniref:V-type ATP synthase subunit I n=1 Tax=Anaerosphaera multitolerans TaxID=2487351 RepID=A0A437S4Q7_9FIRM|nr:V-type ATP synthase subunit I [Anaerosphaera multitolerans]RVU53937.1 V-type ATP synthase subunit I [Anaerosphaera multitolerans]
MAIVKMSKFNLFTFDSDRSHLLKKLQKFNEVHFNDLESGEDDYLTEISVSDLSIELDSEIAKAKWAIDLLKDFVEKKGMVEALKEGNKNLTLKELTTRAQNFDFKLNYEKLFTLVEERNSLEQRILNIESNLSLLKPWENIKVPVSELVNFGNIVIETGTVPNKFEGIFFEEVGELKLSYAEKMSKDKNYIYVVVYYDLSEKEEFLEILKRNGFVNVDIKTEGLVGDKVNSLENEIEEIKNKIDLIEKEIESNKDKLEDFQIYYEYLRNNKLRIESSENFIKTNKIDIIEGYVPTSDKDSLIELLDEVLNENYYIEIEDADRDDPKVPIKLKNNKFVSAFESITSMYAMPKYNEIDPTPLFAPFYFIFAGIMVGDMGYGLLLFLGTLFALKKFNLDKGKRQMLTFLMYLGISTILWGLVFGSFFGDMLELKSLINPSEDYIEMIIMSLTFGGIHIIFALGIKGYMNLRDKKPLDALFDVGFWYMAVIGAVVAVMAFVLKLSPMIFNVSRIIMVLGMVGIVLTGGRAEKSKAAKLGWGIYSLYGITSYFSDFVSYLRLMALALSGSFIAVALNIIVRMLVGKGILGIIAGAFVFIVFQLFNMFLSYLSAYVHSARLTYVEMFNKFYDGGGIPFKSLIVNSKYFNIEGE